MLETESSDGDEADWMSAGHDHAHEAPESWNRAFAVGILLNLAFVVAEVAYGVVADSMALIADAGHNLSDVLGLVLAWAAAGLARREPTRTHTYGLRRSTILAALANALLLLVAVGGITWESIRRLAEPAEVAGTTVMIVAGIGVVINTLTALLFMAGRKSDLNIRGAFLHMVADALVSVGVVGAGALVLWSGADWVDPVVSLVIAAVITWGTWDLLRDSLGLALDAVPSGIDIDEVEAHLERLDGVEAVHDLHVWGMSTSEAALTAHLIKPDPAGDDDVIGTACVGLRRRFGITHVTLQFERSHDGTVCEQASPLVV